MFNNKFVFFLNFLFISKVMSFDFLAQNNLEVFSYFDTVKVSKNNLNESSTHFFKNELRDSFKFEFNDSKFYATPSLAIDFASSYDQLKLISKVKLSMYEFYLFNSLVEGFDFSIGYLNFQWGPSEFSSFSNSIFHTNFESRSSFFKNKGKYLYKFSYTPSQRFSLIFISEFANNKFKRDYDEFLFNSKFNDKFLIKSELSFEKATDYIGFTASIAELSSKNLGMYANLNFNDFTSLYTDSRFSFNSSYYDFKNGEIYFKKNKFNQMNSLLNIGLRFEDRFDFRLEYIYNQIGLSKNEMKKLNSQILNSNFAKILKKSGREIIGKQYVYSSLRIPNLGKSEDLTIFFRNLHSLQDHSNVFELNFEKNLHENVIGIIESSVFEGPISSELKSFYDYNLKLGARINF